MTGEDAGDREDAPTSIPSDADAPTPTPDDARVPDSRSREGRRRDRWLGLLAVTIARARTRAVQRGANSSLAVVGAVALTIGLLVLVTGVALGLAAAGTAGQDDADVRIEPGGGDTLSGIDGVEAARLGGTNERAAELRDEEGVDHASPVLVETIPAAGADAEAAADGSDESGADDQRVLAVGVVPGESSTTVATLPTDALEPGDPHYADGSYDGPRAGEAVLSPAAAHALGVDEGDEFTVGTGDTADSFTAVSVADPVDGADADAGDPVVVVPLSELQAITGGDDGELADRLLLWGDEEAATGAAESSYPDASVSSTGGVSPAALFDDQLALAAALVAMVVGVGICALFVATTAGIAIDEDRRSLAVLAMLGFSLRSRLATVAVSTLLTTVGGAVLGIGLGVAGVVGLNAVAEATFATGAVAHVHPLFVPYALVVALVAGLLALPYPLSIAARTEVLEEVGR